MSGREEKLRKALERFRREIEKVFADGRAAEFLRFAARFRRYSFHNTMLIYLQRPDATWVAGLRTWNELGRRVRKGERGIVIFAPVLVRQRLTVSRDGEEREEEREVVVGFKAVRVFDVSQTEGRPLPENPFALRALEGEDEAGIFARLAGKSPLPIRFEPTLPAEGYLDPDAGEIVLGEHLSPAMRTKVLLHELSHYFAGHGSGEGGEEERDMMEVVAEGAAFLAAEALGLDTSSYSLGYVAGWGRDFKKILSAGRRIFEVAEKVLVLAEEESPAAAVPAFGQSRASGKNAFKVI